MDLASARDELRRAGRTWVARIRFVAVTAFLLIAVGAGPVHGLPQWTALVPLLAAYWLAAVSLTLVGRWPRAGALSAWALPTIDVAVLWALQARAVATAPSPGYVVGWTIGLFLFTMMLSAFTFDVLLLAATGATGAIAQSSLILHAGFGADLVATNCTMLALGAVVTAAGARKVESAIVALFANERARLEAEERAAALRREHEAVRQWTELIVHDLKQPLTSATALADLCVADLDRGRGNPRADLLLISSELQRIQHMVSDLVMLSRLEEGVLKPQISEHPVQALLERIRAVHSAEASAKGVVLEVDAIAGLSGNLDAVLVLRAVENLVSNALRFAGKGHRVRLHAARADNAIVVAVQNDGPPVPAAARPWLFQKRTSTETRHEHAGLGLYFCRLVAEAHGGAARLHESPDWPVDFRIELPA